MDQAKGPGGSAGIGLAIGVALGLVSSTMIDQLGLVFGSVVEHSRKDTVTRV